MLINFIHFLRKIFNLQPGTFEAMESFLVYYYYGFLSLLFILTVAAAVFSWRYFYREFKKISTNTWVILLLIFNLALILRFFVLPHHPHVFFDEATFIETAENYAEKGLNLQNHEGTTRNRFLICSTGWPFLISLVFKVVGVNIEAAFSLSAALSTLTTILVFLTVYLLFDNPRAGLWSAFIFSVYPVLTKLSISAAMGTSSVFFAFLTLTVFLMYFRYRKPPLLYFSFLSLAFLINMRQEAFIALLPLMIVFFVFFHPNIRSEFKNAHFYLASFLLLIFVIPPTLASVYGVSTGFYYFYESPEMMRKHILTNLKYNVAYWFYNKIQPLSVTIMALVGLWMVFKKRIRLGLYFAGWIIFLQIFYSLNPSCDFSTLYTLDSWRTAAHLLIPVIILAGIVPDLAVQYFEKHHPKAKNYIIALFMLIVIMIPVRFFPFISSRSFLATEYLFVKNVTRNLPENSVVIVDGALNPVRWESYVSLFNYNSPVEGVHYPELIPGKPWSGRVIFRDIAKWSKEKRPVFVYFFGQKLFSGQPRIYWFQDKFNLKMQAGIGIRKVRSSFIFYRVAGIKNPPPYLKTVSREIKR